MAMGGPWQQRLPEKARMPFPLPYQHWKGVEETQALPRKIAEGDGTLPAPKYGTACGHFSALSDYFNDGSV